MYFEANVFGYHTYSFTTKGFFDKEGYVEPMLKHSGVRWFLNNWATPANLSLAALLITAVGIIAVVSMRKPREKVHVD